MIYFDVNELSEERRLGLCATATEILPELNVQLLENTRAGVSKLYNLEAEYRSRRSNVIVDQIVLEAFACPSRPSMYIHLGQSNESVFYMSAIIEEDETEFQPLLNITGYVALIAESITVFTGESLLRELNEDESESSKDAVQKEEETDSPEAPVKFLGFVELQIKKSKIDTDQLTQDERLDICERVKKLFFGSNIAYAADVLKLSRYYKVESSMDEEFDDHLVNAYECPTSPIVYIHISEFGFEDNIVYAIVREEDF